MISNISSSVANNLKIKKSSSRNRLIRGVDDDNWKSFINIIKQHNKTYPKSRMTMKKFFKLIDTYSPLIESMMCLDPENNPSQQLGVNTALNLAPMWIRNVGCNIERIKSEHDIRDLRNKYEGKAAIVVGAGESLFDNASKTNHLEIISNIKDNFDGVIIVTDRMLESCLRYGFGDYFTVVDGSPIIAEKFFNTAFIHNLSDHIAKQEDKSSHIKGIITSCVHPEVLKIWKGETYFFVASIPQEILPNATRFLNDVSGREIDGQFYPTTDINSGGNCGMLGWNLACWMGCSDIALVGMDYSYKLTTPLENTSNWHQFIQLGEEAAKKAFHEGYNPFFKSRYVIDDIYQSFKDVALNWIPAFEERGFHTFNCTEGGSLHGKGINSMYLKDFLEAHTKK